MKKLESITIGLFSLSYLFLSFCTLALIIAMLRMI